MRYRAEESKALAELNWGSPRLRSDWQFQLATFNLQLSTQEQSHLCYTETKNQHPETSPWAAHQQISTLAH